MSSSPPGGSGGVLDAYLADCRERVLHEIRALIPRDHRHTGRLYEMMLDYPMRPAKALRPALSIAACRMFGGGLDLVLPSAAALELYHNAFLLHDDVEDGSELRRGGETLHRRHGMPVAVNVGDGMLALALRPLLDNARHIGLGPSQHVLDAVAEMARETAEGQAMELLWIATGDWDLHDRDYLRMVYKKSTHYSFVTPLRVGAYCARAPEADRRRLERFGALLGIAFQIQDDVLNVAGRAATYGKEIGGDLWEGKRTLLLLHALRTTSPERRAWAVERLRLPREARTAEDVAALITLLEETGSLDHARALASRHTGRAARMLDELVATRGPSVHLDFLHELCAFVVGRDR